MLPIFQRPLHRKHGERWQNKAMSSWAGHMNFLFLDIKIHSNAYWRLSEGLFDIFMSKSRKLIYFPQLGSIIMLTHQTNLSNICNSLSRKSCSFLSSSSFSEPSLFNGGEVDKNSDVTYMIRKLNQVNPWLIKKWKYWNSANLFKLISKQAMSGPLRVY